MAAVACSNGATVFSSCGGCVVLYVTSPGLLATKSRSAENYDHAHLHLCKQES